MDSKQYYRQIRTNFIATNEKTNSHKEERGQETPVVNLSMMRLVYFTLNKKHKKINAIITYACFGIILVEKRLAGAFL